MSAEIIKALVGVMGEVGAITKNRKNPQQGYNFRGIDDVYNSLQPALIKHGVVVVPSFKTIAREERQTKAGGTLIYTNVQGEFRFCHVGGSEITATAYGEGMDSSDKSTNKAMSAAFKYALLQTLCIPTEEHIDSETETPQPAHKPAPQKPAAPAEKEVLAVEFVPSDLKEEAGEKDGKPWVRTYIYNDAVRYKTFDKKLAEVVKSNPGERIRVEYEVDRWGNTITELRLA